MISYWHFFDRRISALCSTLVLLILVCSACGSDVGGGNKSIPYNNQAGHILVQLFSVPGFIYPPVNGVPVWTLYGDGTLVFQADNTDQLSQAQLSTTDVQHILDVVVNQDAFFASTKTLYGRLMADVGSTLLRVDANNQHKQVNLFAPPDGTTDIQTQHVFAIERFLQGYRAAHVQPYAASGVALLVIADRGANMGNSSPWPFSDIKLDQIAAQECNLASFLANCDTKSNTKSGIFSLYGQRSAELMAHTRFFRYEVTQDGKSYILMIWPLLPDVLAAQPDGSHRIQVTGADGGNWPLLVGPGSGTPTPAGK